MFILAPSDTELEVEEVDQDDSQALDEESTPWEGPQNAEAGELSLSFISLHYAFHHVHNVANFLSHFTFH